MSSLTLQRRISQPEPSASFGGHGTVLRGHVQRPLQNSTPWYYKTQNKLGNFDERGPHVLRIFGRGTQAMNIWEILLSGIRSRVITDNDFKRYDDGFCESWSFSLNDYFISKHINDFHMPYRYIKVRGSKSFADHVPLRHFDGWKCSPTNVLVQKAD